jgi:hypothetical protein
MEISNLSYILVALSVITSVSIAGVIVILAIYRWSLKRSALAQVSAIPIYKKPDLKLYEIGTLLDGKLHKEDIIAVAAEQHLAGMHNPDAVESYIAWNLNTSKELKQFKRATSNDSRNSRNDFIRHSNSMVYNKLKKLGYYIYNPWFVRFASLAFIFVLFIITIEDSDEPRADDVDMIVLAVTLPMHTLALLMAIFSYTFHENLDKVVPKIQEIKGYKMFFETTEKHTTLRDLQKYEKQMPLMIALGVYRDQWDELIDYLVEKWK